MLRKTFHVCTHSNNLLFSTTDIETMSSPHPHPQFGKIGKDCSGLPLGENIEKQALL